MGKSKTKKTYDDKFEGKTQELEERSRVSKGFVKANPVKSK